MADNFDRKHWIDNLETTKLVFSYLAEYPLDSAKPSIEEHLLFLKSYPAALQFFMLLEGKKTSNAQLRNLFSELFSDKSLEKRKKLSDETLDTIGHKMEMNYLYLLNVIISDIHQIIMKKKPTPEDIKDMLESLTEYFSEVSSTYSREDISKLKTYIRCREFIKSFGEDEEAYPQYRVISETIPQSPMIKDSSPVAVNVDSSHISSNIHKVD